MISLTKSAYKGENKVVLKVKDESHLKVLIKGKKIL